MTGAAPRHHLLFDGDCGICTWLAERFRRMDADRGYVVVPFQYLDDAALAGLGVTRAQCASALRVVTARGRVYGGAFAVNHALWSRPAWRPVVVLIYAMPVLLLSEVAGYAVVARQRTRLSRWFGLRGCRVPERDGRRDM